MPSVTVESLRPGDMVDLEEDPVHLRSPAHDPACACQFEYAVVAEMPSAWSVEATTIDYGPDAGMYDYPHGHTVELAGHTP